MGAAIGRLPLWLPGFGLVEKLFSRLKTPLRQAATRIVDAFQTLWNEIGRNPAKTGFRPVPGISNACS
jgi:hypothetical protein